MTMSKSSKKFKKALWSVQQGVHQKSESTTPTLRRTVGSKLDRDQIKLLLLLKSLHRLARRCHYTLPVMRY